MPYLTILANNCQKLVQSNKQKLQQIHIYPNDSIMGLIQFFYYIPNDISCCIKKSNKQNYKTRINFYFQQNLIYHIFLNDDFTNYQFLLDAYGYNLKWQYRIINNTKLFTLDYQEIPTYGSKKFPFDHPYIKIGKFIYKSNNFCSSQLLNLFVDPEISKYIKRHEKQMQKDFLKYFQENFDGSIIIYSTDEKCEKLQQLDQSNYLFSLTYIFPWAIALLRNNFSCFMTDATFKAMKPYILTILNIIVCNESLPIGISVAPTETSSEYQRLWDHLLSIARSLHCDPKIFSSHPFVCDQGSGLKKFLEDNNLQIKYCHRHLIENFGSSSLIGNYVSRILRTSSQEDFEKTSLLIRIELAIFLQNLGKNIPANVLEKINKLKMMLGIEEADSDL